MRRRRRLLLLLLLLLLVRKVRIGRIVGVGRVHVLRNGRWSILTRRRRPPSLLRRVVGVCSTRTSSFRLSRRRRRRRRRRRLLLLLLLGRWRWRRRIVRTRSRPQLRSMLLLLLGPVLMLRVVLLLLLPIPQRCKLELIERRRCRRQRRHVGERGARERGAPGQVGHLIVRGAGDFGVGRDELLRLRGRDVRR